MKRLLVVLGVLLAIPVLAVVAILARGPSARAPSTEKVQPTPARLARGEYLAKHVAGCVDCHSSHDYAAYAAPVLSAQFGGGGMCLTEDMGFPGHVCAPNISSDPVTGIGGWSDGELLRAFQEGVSKDGHALFGLMPFEDFRNLSDEDARSIVAYVRTLAPVRNTVVPRKLKFPLNVFTQLAPKPMGGPVAALTPGTPAYGQYLTEMAGCAHCHTPMVHGKPVEARAFAGGVEWKGPWGRVISRNITPDDETGIGQMTREAFVGRFKSFEHLDPTARAPAGRNTVMPWRTYAGMTEADLGQIYDYLRTVPKVRNAVNAFPDAK